MFGKPRKESKKKREESILSNLPGIALGAWGDDGTFGNALTAEAPKPVFGAAIAGECGMDGSYEPEHFDHFICRILATHVDGTMLNEKGRIDCHTFKPVLFEFPTYAYFMTGEKAGDCGRMNT